MSRVPTVIENLLRLARSECAATIAFAAIPGGARGIQLVSVPPGGSSEGLPPDTLEELVCQASSDPEYEHARVFVRAVKLDEPMTLAIAPLRSAGARSMLAVAAGAGRDFEPAHFEVLDRLGQRLERHVEVVRRLESSPPAERAREAAGSHDDVPTGTVPGSPARRPPAAADLAAPLGAPAGEDGAAQRPVTGRRSPVRGAEHDALPPAPGDGGAYGYGTSPQEDASGGGETERWWREPDMVTGLPSLARFFSRAGRLLAADGRATGALGIVVVELPESATAAGAAKALATQLRCSDPLARVDRRLLAAAVLVFPAGRSGDAVEIRLGDAVRVALAPGATVRTAHVLAQPGDPREVDELLRTAIAGLRARVRAGDGR